METKEITIEMRAKLKAPLPKEAISEHPTKTFLSTIKAIYVVERLNDVFGVGKWHQKSEVIVKDGKMIVVKSILTIPEYGVELEAFGGNDNQDLGDAYKGASTDALTKIGSFLEIGIDVFKGLSNKPAAKPLQNTTAEKWLNPNTPEWTSAVTWLRDGHKIAEIETKYKISKINKEQLIAESI
jgi:hypothetical protein